MGPMFNLSQFLTPPHVANPTAAVGNGMQGLQNAAGRNLQVQQMQQQARQYDRSQSWNEFNTTRNFETERSDLARQVMAQIIQQAQTDPEKAKLMFPMAQSLGLQVDTGESSAAAPEQSAFVTPERPPAETPPAQLPTPPRRLGMPTNGEREITADTPVGTTIMSIRDVGTRRGAPTVAADAEEQPAANPMAKRIDDAVNPILAALGAAPMQTPVKPSSAPIAHQPVATPSAPPALAATVQAPPPAAATASPRTTTSSSGGAGRWKFSLNGLPFGESDVGGFAAVQRQRANQLGGGLKGLDTDNIGVAKAISAALGVDNPSPEQLMEIMKSPLLPILLAHQNERTAAINAGQRQATQGNSEFYKGASQAKEAIKARGLDQMAQRQQMLDNAIKDIGSENGYLTLTRVMEAYKAIDPRISDADAAARLLGYQGPLDKFRNWLSVATTGDLSPETKQRLIAGMSQMAESNRQRMQVEFEGLAEDADDFLTNEGREGYMMGLQRGFRGYGIDPRVEGVSGRRDGRTLPTPTPSPAPPGRRQSSPVGNKPPSSGSSSSTSVKVQGKGGSRAQLEAELMGELKGFLSGRK